MEDSPAAGEFVALREPVSDSTEAAIPIAAELLSDSQFKPHLETLRSFLTRSLEVRFQPIPLMELQVDMAAFVLGIHKEETRLRSDLVTQSGSDLQRVEKVMGVCKRLRAIVRQIGDGIAWRTLGYDRAILRLLALKPHTGAMEEASAIAELSEAWRWVEDTGDLVVVNDLTNYLRYGDFMSVGIDSGVSIHEVKSGRSSAKSRRARRQARKAAELIDFVRFGYAEGKDGLPTKIVPLKTQLVSHFGDLERLIDKAQNSGSAYARIGDCLAVNVFDSVKAGDRFAAGEKLGSLAQNPFNQSSESYVADSLKFYTAFSWNVAPYSVFPISPEDRFGIMTGSIWVASMFNFGNLYRCLRRRNLYVKPPVRAVYEEWQDLMPGEVGRRELDNPLVVSRGPPNPVLQIPISGLTRLLYEFLSEESFADVVEEKLELAASEDRPALIRESFECERKLWD